MPLATLLLPEFHREMKSTRNTLEALPEGQSAYRPHARSMALAELAPHTALLPAFISLILTGPDLDMATAKFPPLTFESRDQIIQAFDGMAAKTATDLEAVTDERFDEPWVLSAAGRAVFSGTRYQAYRTLGINHMVHHRAQLGVYLRLLDLPVPSTYGPSADSAG